MRRAGAGGGPGAGAHTRVALRRLQLANLRLNAARRRCPCSPALSPAQACEAAGQVGGTCHAACARLCTRVAERPRCAARRTPQKSPPVERCVRFLGALAALAPDSEGGEALTESLMRKLAAHLGAADRSVRFRAAQGLACVLQVRG